MDLVCGVSGPNDGRAAWIAGCALPRSVGRNDRAKRTALPVVTEREAEPDAGAERRGQTSERMPDPRRHDETDDTDDDEHEADQIPYLTPVHRRA